MALYAGRKGAIYMSTSGAGAASLVPGQSAFSLNMATDKIEVTSFGDSNKVYVQGLPDVQISFSGHWDDTSDAIYDASVSTTAVKMYLYPSTDAPSKYWYGTAWVD